MHPIEITVTLAAAVSNGVAQAQAVTAATPMTLNGSLVSGGVATLDSGGAARRVLFTFAADESTNTFTVVGTRYDPGNRSNQIALTEAVTGTATTAFTTQDFVTVTSVTPTNSGGGNVTVGTNGIGSSQWVPWDRIELANYEISAAGFVLSGSPTWQVDVTYDDVYGTWLPSNLTYPRPLAWPSLTGKTGTASDTISAIVVATRLTLTAVGAVQISFNQQTA